MNAKVAFISDLHLGHDNILNWQPSRHGKNIHDHDRWIISQWNSVIRKRDTVYVLGDVAFSREALTQCSLLNGNKNIILGNHDKYDIELYQQYFKVCRGIMKYKGFWLSHAPVHPNELRGCHNIHGHVHHKTIPDKRYINVCVEALHGTPIFFDQIKQNLT